MDLVRHVPLTVLNAQALQNVQPVMMASTLVELITILAQLVLPWELVPCSVQAQETFLQPHQLKSPNAKMVTGHILTS